jgi:hypothetical protein
MQALELVLFTLCPPGPDDRTNYLSISYFLRTTYLND